MSLKDYLRGDTNQSSMRLMAFLVVVTACIVALGAVGGFVLAIIRDKDAGIIGALLGGCAGLVGALLVPAFGGKALQTFAEGDKPDNTGGEGK